MFKYIHICINFVIGITVTLWNTAAENFDDSFSQSVILFKDIKVDEYYGKISLTCLRDTTIIKNPNSQEAHHLTTWFSKQEKDALYKPVVAPITNELQNITQIKNSALSNPVTVAAIIFNIDDIKSFFNKTTDREIKKRNVTLTDLTENVITLTLWNTEAENFKGKTGDILLINNAMIKEYQNMRTLSFTNGTTILQNPDIPEKNDLIQWFNSNGQINVLKKITNMALSKNIDI